MVMREYLEKIKALQEMNVSYQLQFEELLEKLKRAGGVVFPARPDRPKTPAGRWATEEDIQKMLQKKITSTSALLYAEKSGLLVVDIDDIESFCQEYSVSEEDIAATATVKTGRGYHIYVENDGSVREDIKFGCGDIKAKLVVVAGSRLWNESLQKNVEYRVLNPVVYDTRTSPVWLQQVLKDAIENKKVDERIQRKDYVYSDKVNSNIDSVVNVAKEMYEAKEIDGWTVEAGLSSYLVKAGKTDEEIHSVFEYVYQREYDRKRTQYIINTTRAKGVGIYREFFEALKRRGINLFSGRQKEEKKQKEEIDLDEILSYADIYASDDMKHFYLVLPDRVVVGSRDDAKMWLLRHFDSMGVSVKESTLKLMLTRLKQVKLCFNPEMEYGYSGGVLNAFKHTEYMRRYATSVKSIDSIEKLVAEVSYENIAEPVLQEYIKNIFLSDDDFRAFMSFLTLKLAGEKAGYIFLFATNQGAGKSNVLTELMRRLLSPEYVLEMNYSQLTNKSSFNGEFENKYLIVLEEMHIRDSNKDDKHIYESLKRDSRARKILINKKGINPYETDFYADFIGYTNNSTPIVLSEKDDTRVILVKNFESRRLSDIYGAYGYRTFADFYSDVERAFIDYVESVLYSIDAKTAREYLERYVGLQNSTVKKELMLATNKVYQLVEEYRNIDDMFVREPKPEEMPSVRAVRAGVCTMKDISIVLRLMGATSLADNHRRIADELEKLGVAERRTERRRYKVLSNALLELKTTEIDEIHLLATTGKINELEERFQISIR